MKSKLNNQLTHPLICWQNLAFDILIAQMHDGKTFILVQATHTNTHTLDSDHTLPIDHTLFYSPIKPEIFFYI